MKLDIAIKTRTSNNRVDKWNILRLYKNRADWVLYHNSPNVDFLRDNFTRRELEHFGIYIDRKFNNEIVNRHIAQIFHNCTGKIRVELNEHKVIIPTLYLANGCDMKVEVAKDIDIPVFLFDESKADIDGKWVLKQVNLDRYGSK